ncbi:MAG: class I SAM-dependent methyltransferase [Oscillibacter sp.]|nr:class I SAM-dependent methyltransferase [Oscillibacter sp.]
MQKKLELTPRLQLLANWVPQNARLADIGTDHGYLPIWLLLQDRIAAAIASDLRPGPLSRAKADAAQYGVADRLDCRLCDGLAEISPQEVDTIVIAGMGGENIADILSAAPWTADGLHQLLVQPMSRAEVLREYLMKHGYRIEREQLVLDRGVLYPVLLVSAGTMNLTAGQMYAGAGLQKDPLENQYLIEWIIRFQNAIAGLKRSSDPADAKKADALRDLVYELMMLREEWRCANS